MSYQYPLLRVMSLRNRDNARFAATVGIARENIGSHDHGPIRASLKVAVQISEMHSNHSHEPSNHLGGRILDRQKKYQQKQFNSVGLF